MGLFDKIKEITRPFDDDDFIEEEGYVPAASNAGTPAPGYIGRSATAARAAPPDYANEFSSRFAADTIKDNKVVNIHTTTQVQVVLVKPERFDTAAEIADQLRNKRTVIINMEQTNRDVARRLLDFLSGVAYAQDGKIKKVAVSTYMITPQNVDFVGDLLDELENSGHYF